MNELGKVPTRQRIEEAAITVLAEAGLDGFTASRLAAAADVSKANLYHHFSGLDEIVLASFERLAMGMFLISPPKGTPLQTWLTEMGHSLIEMPDAQRGAMRAYLVFFMRAMVDDRLRAKIGETLTDSLAAVATIIGELSPRLLDAEELEALARLILIAGDGFVVHAQMLDGDVEALKRSWALLVESIVPKGEVR